MYLAVNLILFCIASSLLALNEWRYDFPKNKVGLNSTEVESSPNFYDASEENISLEGEAKVRSANVSWPACVKSERWQCRNENCFLVINHRAVFPLVLGFVI